MTAQAILEEWLSHVRNGTWELVDCEQGMDVIPCHWVFDIKINAEGKLVRFKARLVADGNWQTDGVNVGETHAPVVQHLTMRTFFAIAARMCWIAHQVDLKTAFLHGQLSEIVCMRQPPGFADGINMVRHLKKSLYGLRQAPHVWYNNMSDALASIGFQKVSFDPSLWYCNKYGLHGLVYLTSIVDDLAIGGPSEQMTLKVVKAIQDKYPGKHSGRIYHFAGLKLVWDDPKHCVYITQPAYIEEMLDKFSKFFPNQNL